jgi:mono/diheme cytochrome c family protein
MHKLIHNFPTVSSGMAAALFAGFLCVSVASAGGEEKASEAEGDKPYTVKNGKVDEATFIGWRTFNGNCARCHGETATGSTFAPSLITRMKGMVEPAFAPGRPEEMEGGEQEVPEYLRKKGK